MLRRQLLIGASVAPLLPVLPRTSFAHVVAEAAPERDADSGISPAAEAERGGQIEALDEKISGSLEGEITLVSHTATTPSSTELQQALRLINNERTRRGVAPLILASKLNCAAQKHARYMSTARRCSHTGSGSSTYVQRIEACGYKPWRRLGENVACGHSTWSAAMRAWMNSSGHRANILSPRFRNVGLGRYNHHYVQDFGTQ